MSIKDNIKWSMKKKFFILTFLIIAIFCILYNFGILFKIVPGYVFVTEWGFEDSRPFQFDYPDNIAIDSKGYVYVSDGYRIQKFNPDGKFIQQWGSKGEYEYGSKTNPPGYFNLITDIFIDSVDNIYVVDTGSPRIQKFDSNGKFLTMWSKSDVDTHKLPVPNKIVVGDDGNILGTDSSIFVWRFDYEGNFISSWKVLEKPVNDISYLRDIKLDSEEHIYIASSLTVDMESNEELEEDRHIWFSCIYQFDLSGKLLNHWNPYKTNRWNEEISSIALDSKGNIFIVEPSKNRIQVFDSTGKFITRWGFKGFGKGQFRDPQDIAIDHEDNVYVVDSGNNRIQKFRPFHN